MGLGVVAVAVLIGGVFWYQDKQKHEATDNAFVQADTVQVSPQISGYVTQVLVEDNQVVAAGQALAVLDQAPVQARLDAALANVAALEAAVRGVDDKASTEQAVIAQRIAAIASAEAAAAAQKADADRYATLQAQGIVSPQCCLTSTANAQQAQAAVTQARAALEAERRTAEFDGLRSAPRPWPRWPWPAPPSTRPASILTAPPSAPPSPASSAPRRSASASRCRRASPCSPSCRYRPPTSSPISRRRSSAACALASR